MGEHLGHNSDGMTDWIFSRTGVATAVAILILGFLVYTGHSAHLLGALPWLLILACPLMHVFMHGGHGHHHGLKNDASTVEDKERDGGNPERPPEKPIGHHH